MKSSVDLLTSKQQELLAGFYGTEAYEALRALIDIERLELAKDTLDLQDILIVRHYSGQAHSLKKLIETLATLNRVSEAKAKKN